MIDIHFKQCASCRKEFEHWSRIYETLQAIKTQTPNPRPDLFQLVEQRIDERNVAASLHRLVEHTFRLGGIVMEHVGAQLRLVRHDLWWMPLPLIPLALAIAIFARQMEYSAPILAFLGSLITALGLAFLYARESDPAREVILSTPMPAHLLLYLRSGIMFTYNLLINLLCLLPLLLTQGTPTLSWFITNWLAPLCCLTALSLLVSVLCNANAAIFLCMLLWILRLLASSTQFHPINFAQQYESFWHQSPALFLIAFIAACISLLFINRRERYIL
ncbi:hypothetical protein KSX_59990 [Ktedonospora formicarum]|uniref:Uncharacterized protein n=2 Tax=Ktedonospora formicarum TaxID=2778364 RepID=A0A8J3I5M2_9CHLR|nr:hypothetical protein KSX_59990 [Ktedonospora formicarum]